MIEKIENFTHNEFKIMKRELKITNKDIADLLNCSEQNIRNHSSPNKELGKIPISMLFIYRKMYADLTVAHFRGSAIDLSGANLSGVNLRGADLSGAILSGANLSDTDLSGAFLSGANLIGVNLRGANLIGANLIGANLALADLSDADLSGVIISNANLTNTKRKELKKNYENNNRGYKILYYTRES